MIDVTFVIVNYNKPQLVARCVESIDRYLNAVSREVVIVDNNSHEECLDELERQNLFVRIIRMPANVGFGQANNIGAKNARSDLLLFLNSDTELLDYNINDAIKRFRKERKKELWGFHHVWPDGRFQNSFSREISYIVFLLSYQGVLALIPFWKGIGDNHRYNNAAFDSKHEVSVIYGTSILVWKSDFMALGGFSKKYFMYFEDIDFCDRFRMNYGKVCFYPDARIMHHVMGSRQKRFSSTVLFKKSLYKYGFHKFGTAKMLFFVFFDVSATMVYYCYRRLTALIFNKLGR
jgi:GT2 family glycosyltransferase